MSTFWSQLITLDVLVHDAAGKGPIIDDPLPDMGDAVGYPANGVHIEAHIVRQEFPVAAHHALVDFIIEMAHRRCRRRFESQGQQSSPMGHMPSRLRHDTRA